MAQVTEATIKRLFTMAGNRCAYRGCDLPLVDQLTKKVTGRICHIKGNKLGSKRHDRLQSDAERQGFDNLILMCPTHHDIIDSDEQIFTEEVLRALKSEHEAKVPNQNPNPEVALAELFVANAIVNGSIVNIAGQTGGQAANLILNNYLAQPSQVSEWQRELENRQLLDPTSADFACTKYAKHLGMIDPQGKFYPTRTTAALFAQASRPFFSTADELDLVKWMASNQRRYEPCFEMPYVPSGAPVLRGTSRIWHDGQMAHSSHAYLKYIAIERNGFVEQGFAPAGLIGENQSVYYALTLAHFIGFLRFIHDLAEYAKIDKASINIGIAIRGTLGIKLKCLVIGEDQPMRAPINTKLPSCSGFLFHRSGLGADWNFDEIAYEFAESLIEHWDCTRPSWVPMPEFTDRIYTGGFFKKHFSDWR